jgi:hypothetical protein
MTNSGLLLKIKTAQSTITHSTNNGRLTKLPPPDERPPDERPPDERPPVLAICCCLTCHFESGDLIILPQLPCRDLASSFIVNYCLVSVGRKHLTHRKFDQKLKKRNFFCGRVLSIVPHPRERDSGTPEIEILGDSRARKLSCSCEFIAHMNKG